MVYVKMVNTAILREVVGKTARDNPERYCAWFCIHCFKEWHERPWTYVCECLRKATKEASTASVSETVY